MAYQAVFRRYELKYLMTLEQKQRLPEAMAPYMQMDHYGRTTNIGSLFRLTYDLILRDGAKEKEMIDKLRCRNGNLEITVSRQEASAMEL